MNLPDLLAPWCAQHLGAALRETLFERHQLSYVVGVRLDDGREVVVKVRPPNARLDACTLVQRHVWERGFPCPALLVGPSPFGELTATAEAHLPAGELLSRDADAPRRFATALALLVSLAPAPDEVPSLAPAPPWLGWGHTGAGTWPYPDNLAADLNTVAGPAWLDDLGARLRARLCASTLPAVIGHADWESQNLRWQDGELVAVHDWDSVVALPEMAIAGAAAAVFPADRLPLSDATVAESEAFLVAYAAARGRPWSDEERQLAWAAGLWVRAFNAKKAFVRDPDSLVAHHLKEEIATRQGLAGMAPGS